MEMKKNDIIAVINKILDNCYTKLTDDEQNVIHDIIEAVDENGTLNRIIQRQDKEIARLTAENERLQTENDKIEEYKCVIEDISTQCRELEAKARLKELKENEELKKKIINMLQENIEAEVQYYPEDNYAKVVIDCETIADALIANGIGDVSEWKHKANDYKQRAEVAEKERNEEKRKTEIAQKAGKIIQKDMLRVFGSKNPVINDKINALWDLALQEAECEVKENAIRQALLTVEEDTQ